MFALKYTIICVAVLTAAVFCDESTFTTNANNVSEDKHTTTVNDDDFLGLTTSATPTNLPDFKKLTKKRCSRSYNMNCLKVDLISSIDNLGKNTEFSILPGIKVTSNPDVFASQKTSDMKMVFSADNVGDQLDELLLKRVTNYAKSLSINVQLLDKDQKKGKSFGSSMLDNFIRSVDGRADKKTSKWGSTLMTAAVLTGGTLLWMGLSSLMAMATKALAAALLSIVISCFTAYKTSGHSSHQKSTTTYEIVAKPVYSHAYTAELQDPHSAAASGPLPYGRNMEWDKISSISSRSEIQLPVRDDVHQLAYKAHVRPIYNKRSA